MSSLPDTDYRNLFVTRDGSAARIVLNRPEKRNALSLELMEEMIGALRDASAGRDTRAIVIEGAGPAFSAGHDLSEMIGRQRDSVELFSDGRAPDRGPVSPRPPQIMGFERTNPSNPDSLRQRLLSTTGHSIPIVLLSPP